MGYVDHAPTSFASSGVRSALLYSADGGIDYSADSALLADAKASKIRNMWLENGILTSRKNFGDIIGDGFGEEFPTGTLNAHYTFCASVILHIGTCLYRLHGDTLEKMLDGLPNAHSIPVEFAGKLYLYCQAHIYCTDRSFTAEEVFPTAPLYRMNCHSYNQTGVYVSDFQPNLLAPYVAMTYESEKRENSYSGYYFPRDMDHSRGFEVYFEDRLLEPEEYTATEEKFSLNTLKQTVANTVKLCYYSTNAQLDVSQKLAACTIGTAFGGGTVTGTRVFLAGNPDYPGSYFTGELGDALCFFEGSGGTVGESAGNLTGFSKQQGYLLLFSESTVSRMSYNYTSAYGGYFTVKTIHAGIGCDMPGSIALADNRTVFANSSGGIYLVDSTELFDGMNIIPISRNITDAAREKGFFSVDAAARRLAAGCIYERKYLLAMGGKLFVWDYGTSAYSGSSDYGKAAGKLVWFEFDGIGAEALFAGDNALYTAFSDQDTGNCRIARMGAESDGKSVAYEFRSGNADLGYAHTAKAVTGFAFECRTQKACELQLDFYADGRHYRRVRTRLVPREDGCASCRIPLPRHTLERFRFAIAGNGSGIGIFNLRVDYMLLKEQPSR